MRVVQVLPALLFMGIVLGGCLGGEDAPTSTTGSDETAPEAKVSADTGSVKGKVLTLELDVVAGAMVALVQGPDLVGDTTTAKDGTFTFNKVAPGEYMVQVASVCCNAAVKRIVVQANTVTAADLQMEKIPNLNPFLESDVWKGFIACGAGTPEYTLAVCSIANDPNDDFLYIFNVSEGLHTLVVAMTWEPVGGVSGDQLMLIVERCTNDSCSSTRRYARVAGPSPIIITQDDTTISRGDMQFANITEESHIRLRVFTPFEVAVTYQQPFDVHMHEFYHGPPPEDFAPIPDA